MAHYRIGDDLYDLDPTTWMNVDVSSVQRALGCGISEYMERVESMDVDALQATIWVFRRRKDTGLRLDDVEFTIRDFLASMEETDDDVRETWPQIAADPKAEDKEASLALRRAAYVATLDPEQVARLFVDGELVQEPAPLALAEQLATGT